MSDEDAEVSGLKVDALKVAYNVRGQFREAVRGVTFTLAPGEILGVVGESGSGKSSIAQAVLRLLPLSARVEGSVVLDGVDLVRLREAEMGHWRGSRVGMVFQDPAAALNPVFTISTHIVDTLRTHRRGITRQAARRAAAEAVEKFGVPAKWLNSYPHQLSGGMRQRALIAAAMAADPRYIVADEPTSSLDTVSQIRVLRLLKDLAQESRIGILVISHDIRVVAAICDRIAVIWQGRLVECGSAAEVLSTPRHSYTAGLLHVSTRSLDDQGRFAVLPDQFSDYDLVASPDEGVANG